MAICALVAAIPAPAVQAENNPVVANVYYSGARSAAEQNRLAGLVDSKMSFIDVDRVSDSQIQRQQNLAPSCIVTLDQISALRLLKLRSKKPYVLFGLSQVLLNKLSKTYRQVEVNVSGLSRDLDSRTLFALAQAVSEKGENVGLFLSQRSRFWRARYEQIANRFGFEPDFVYLQNHETAAPFSGLFANEVKWIIWQDDELLRNNGGLKPVSLSNLKRQRYVIGSLARDIENGALMAVIADPEQLARQQLSKVDQVCNRGQYGIDTPKGYKMLYNEHLARNLGFTSQLMAEIEQKLYQILKQIEGEK